MKGYILAYYPPKLGGRLAGTIQEDDVYADGTSIHTSHVTAIDVHDGKVMTNSGSVYRYQYDPKTSPPTLATPEAVYEMHTYRHRRK